MLVEYPLHEGDDDDPKHPTEGDHHHRHGGQQPGLAVTPVSGANNNLRVIFNIVFMAAKRSMSMIVIVIFTVLMAMLVVVMSVRSCWEYSLYLGGIHGDIQLWSRLRCGDLQRGHEGGQQAAHHQPHHPARAPWDSVHNHTTVCLSIPHSDVTETKNKYIMGEQDSSFNRQTILT